MKDLKKEYVKKKDVGFHVNNTQTAFFKSKKYLINYDWILKYDDIIGVAFGNIMRGDDDSFFIILILKAKKTIYFNMTYQSEEMQGFDMFMEKLKDKLDLNQIWKQDKIILAYPKRFRDRELYKPWTHSLETIIHGIERFFGLKHHASGILKEEFKTSFKK